MHALGESPVGKAVLAQEPTDRLHITERLEKGQGCQSFFFGGGGINMGELWHI